jgi:uncharacterized membrane protein YgcG
VTEERQDLSASAEEESRSTESLNPLICSRIVLAAVLIVLTFALLQGKLDGPQFLVAFGGLFAICWISVSFIQAYSNTWYAAIVPSATLVAVAACRIIDGLEHGMHKFGLLIGATILLSGILLSRLYDFLNRAYDSRSGGGVGGSRGGGGIDGGGCGGGCGGGGCGGCGG